MPPVQGKFSNEAQIHRGFEHVRVLQLPKETVEAMGDLAAVHADVGLVEMPFVQPDKQFNTGIWNKGHITGSRPDGERLAKGNMVAAIVSNKEATKFNRGVFDLVSGAQVSQKPHSSISQGDSLQRTNDQRTSTAPTRKTKVGWK